MTVRTEFEEYLSTVIDGSDRVSQAMRYSLLAGGKRIRPLLFLSALQDMGCPDIRPAFPIAAALEMVHTYSLIHDDLPEMDNDDMRRGVLTCHKKFDQATAVLAGDGLLTKAFEMIAGSCYPGQLKSDLIALLAQRAGHKGMILGQSMDLQAEKETCSVDQLRQLDYYKTGQLLTIPLEWAAIMQNMTSCLEPLRQICAKIGLAFQIQDDILDVTASSSQLGKSTSDVANNKTTYVSALGLTQANKTVEELYGQIDSLWNQLPVEMALTRRLVKMLQNRNC